MMTQRANVWLLTGSQHLYGPDVLDQVNTHAAHIAGALNDSGALLSQMIAQPVLANASEILAACHAANADQSCIGVVLWMHTFSPAKQWIAGLQALRKPIAHLHTQFNRDIPWADIDMDFMNLNQSAHGDREFAHMMTRLGIPRRIIVGHWSDPDVVRELDEWYRTAAAWHDAQTLIIARFGDNMRSVAVTDGDRVEAQRQFGYTVAGYGVGDLVEVVNTVTPSEIDDLVALYDELYTVAPSLRADGDQRGALREAARIELGLRRFLQSGGMRAFTTTFEDLHGLVQLPGLAVQRLMTDGYGFGAEGDWKTAALLRAVKVMTQGKVGGTSFMEDYTYHFEPGNEKVLGAHMLEICPTIAQAKPRLEIHPLSIGGKADPVRLVFDTAEGPAINASLVDLGTRFRLIVNVVDVVAPDAPMPKLPVARALWKPRPSMKVGLAAWLYAGGSHHTVFSQSATVSQMADFAAIAGVEFVLIDETTTLTNLRLQ